jgi:hypothetical protein
MRRKWIFIAPLGLVAIAAFAALGGAVVRLLWNALLPPLFGWPAVTFWQALGLLVLCRILFGGMGRHCGGPRWRMKEEDRERLRQRIRERWGAEHPGATPGVQ